jgi:uncharacterized circularly permuted ATP-grasp superfamily protein
VPTYLCSRDDDRAYVLAHLKDLVVKSVAEAGGYGMLIGPQARTRSRFWSSPSRSRLIRATTSPSPPSTFPPCRPSARGSSYPCHVDLRPYVLRGKGAWVSPGGLTRVALRRGSLVVNSSGGGCKDTWIVEDSPC